MESCPYFPPDDYALTILTEAAMQNHEASETTNSRYQERPISRNLTRGDTIESPSTTLISNQPNNHDTSIHSRGSDIAQDTTQDILSDFNPAVLSSRNMEALAFNPRLGRQNPYMNQAYQGIGTQISNNYANNLGILNAESYDDGRNPVRSERMKQSENVLPFGVTENSRSRIDPELRQDSEDQDSGPRRRKKARIEIHSGDDDDEARKKARGRPRVDTKDETAADRRRTQIRMAQRAYRHRKETTIASLEKQVQDLRSANDEMNSMFINLYDFAIGKGLLQREPEFGQQLQSTCERFLALAKISASNDSPEENAEENAKQDESTPESGRPFKAGKSSPKKSQEVSPPISEPAPAWGGYNVSKDDSPEIDVGYEQQNQYRSRHSDLQVITRPTEDNASFPFDLMDLQQYRVEVPQIEDFSQNFFPQSQLPLPNTHAYNEFSFARRLHRLAIERASRLITTTDPSRRERFQQVFGFCLLYESKETIEARLKELLNRTAKETLQQWRAPFVHIGGAGTYYPVHGSEISGELMPKLRTGYSMGPFSPSVSQAQQNLGEDMKCNLPGFEGEFFDAIDVEGYLRGRGLDIHPAADFVTVELDLLALTEAPSPRSISSDSAVSIISPQTPQSPAGNTLLDPEKDTNDFGLDLTINDNELAVSKPLCQTLPFPMGDINWDTDPAMKDSNFGPIFNNIPGQANGGETPSIGINARFGERRTVTLNVVTLLQELLDRAVCLGRAPGFRPSDVNAALMAAVKAGY